MLQDHCVLDANDTEVYMMESDTNKSSTRIAFAQRLVQQEQD